MAIEYYFLRWNQAFARFLFFELYAVYLAETFLEVFGWLDCGATRVIITTEELKEATVLRKRNLTTSLSDHPRPVVNDAHFIISLVILDSAFVLILLYPLLVLNLKLVHFLKIFDILVLSNLWVVNHIPKIVHILLLLLVILGGCYLSIIECQVILVLIILIILLLIGIEFKLKWLLFLLLFKLLVLWFLLLWESFNLTTLIEPLISVVVLQDVNVSFVTEFLKKELRSVDTKVISL